MYTDGLMDISYWQYRYRKAKIIRCRLIRSTLRMFELDEARRHWLIRMDRCDLIHNSIYDDLVEMDGQVEDQEWQYHSFAMPGACCSTPSCWGALWRGAKSYKKGTTRGIVGQGLGIAKCFLQAEVDPSSQIPNYLKEQERTNRTNYIL